MFVQCRHQQCVVGEGECEVHLGRLAVCATEFEILDRPVTVSLWVTAEAHPFCGVIACVRVHQYEWMGAALKRGTRDKPGVEQGLLRLGLRSPVDQVQARAIAIQRSQETG